jgi:alkylated DNA repair dioxygenase AlkB
VQLFNDSLLPLPNAELELHAQWLDAATADRWLAELTAQTPWQQPQVQIYGRHGMAMPRRVIATRV